MTSTTPAARLGRSSPQSARLSTRQRRPGWVSLALVLIVGLIVLGGLLYQRAGAKTEVLVIAAEQVPAGHTITRADVSTVDVAGPVTAITADHLDAVVGRRAAVPLLRNMLVQTSMLSSADALRPGQAQVGVAVAPGQFPEDGVKPGTTVELLQLATVSGGSVRVAGQGQVLAADAVVWSAHSDPSRSGGVLLTLVVPADLVAQVSQASSAGQIAVAIVAPTS